MSKCVNCGNNINDIRQYIYHQKGGCCKKEDRKFTPNLYQLIYGKKSQDIEKPVDTKTEDVPKSPPLRSETPKLEENEKPCEGLKECSICKKRFTHRGFNKHYNCCIAKNQ